MARTIQDELAKLALMKGYDFGGKWEPGMPDLGDISPYDFQYSEETMPEQEVSPEDIYFDESEGQAMDIEDPTMDFEGVPPMEPLQFETEKSVEDPYEKGKFYGPTNQMELELLRKKRMLGRPNY